LCRAATELEVLDWRVPQCPNCSAPRRGEYCAACGQRRIDRRDLSARRFGHDLADEVATLGFKLRTVRTLGTLFVPGKLTEEFLAGRRQPYLSPIKLYFVCAAIFFLAAPVAGFTLTSLIADDGSGELLRLVTARAGARGLDQALFSQRFDLRLPTVYTLALGSGAMAVALMLQALFRRRIAFGAHVVFALHYFSFLYLVTALAGSSRRLGVMDQVAAGAAIALTIPYVCFALRRAYPGSLPWILVKSTVVIVLTLGLNFVADAAAIRLTLAML
jgi:hypothetical protein